MISWTSPSRRLKVCTFIFCQPTNREIAIDCCAQFRIWEEILENDGVKIVLYVDRNLTDLEILADGQRIRQILSNGLSNALKFTEKGKIVVSLRNGDDPVTVVLKVTNSGKGLGNIDPDKLFETFQEGEQAVVGKKVVASTELGLGIFSKAGSNDGW